MGLKSPLWLLAQALIEERKSGRLARLSAKALDLGLLKAESTRGHLFQAAGAVQRFLAEYPKHRALIAKSSPRRIL